MLTPQEAQIIRQGAYIPEHLPDYVQAVTQAECCLLDNFLVYVKGSHISFVGYPLSPGMDPHLAPPQVLDDTLIKAREQFSPEVISILAPALPSSALDWKATVKDSYYRLMIDEIHPDKKLRNLLRRATRELTISVGKAFDCRYKKLVHAFMRQVSIPSETRSIFLSLPRVLKRSECLVISATNPKNQLVAFDLFHFGSENYAFYLFNFYSRRYYVPGASDLLLARGIELARQRGKRFINLGLGVHPGVRGFKEKWGAQPFLDYITCSIEPETATAEDDFYKKL